MLPPDAPARRIIAALDVPDGDTALARARQLAGHVGLVKVGLQLFVAEGPEIVRRLRGEVPELDVFLDLKLHDIPNTMRGAIASARDLGVRFLTVHAGSGVAHLRACVEEAGDAMGILAVTVLTSMGPEDLDQAGHTRTAQDLVLRRVESARAAGCAGLVCSGQELARVREVAGPLATVVPGIRPAGAEVGDQKRVMTPALAVAEGASYLVIGRPILRAEDPAAAADAIAAEMAG